MWECWFGGHVLVNQTYLETAIIETREEIGLSVTTDELHLFDKKKIATDEENVMVSIYGLQRDLAIETMKLEAEEVDRVEWRSPAQLRKIYESEESQWVRYGHETAMLSWLESQFSLK
jgi:8-oxo-dGTP pyrophosphatase MutT (NUDIX family)